MDRASRFTIVLTSLLFAAAAPHALAAAAQSTYSKADFFQALNTAYGENWKRDGGHDAQKYGMSGKVNIEEVPNVAPGGAWRLNLNAACPFPDSTNPASYNYNKVMSFEMPALVTNNQGGMQYAFQTQAVSGLYAPYVEKGVAGHRKDLQKEFKDVQVTLERAAGQDAYTLIATYSFEHGAKPADVTKRLVYLMSKSKFVLCDIVTYSWLANEKIWDDVKGDITGPVSKEMFVVMNPLLRKGNYEVNDSKAAGGAWRMYGDGWSETYENYTDRMELSMGMKIPKGMAQEQAQAAYAQLQAISPAKGGQKLDIYWTDGYIWLTSVYPYAGMTGKQVMNTVQKFTDDYAEDHFKAASKVMKKYR